MLNRVVLFVHYPLGSAARFIRELLIVIFFLSKARKNIRTSLEGLGHFISFCISVLFSSIREIRWFNIFISRSQLSFDAYIYLYQLIVNSLNIFNTFTF